MFPRRKAHDARPPSQGLKTGWSQNEKSSSGVLGVLAVQKTVSVRKWAADRGGAGLQL